MFSIMDLCSAVDALDQVRRAEVTRVFAVECALGINEIPESLKPKVALWLGAEDGAQLAEEQRVVTVRNLWTFETSCFNMLRGRRPLGTQGRLTPDEVAASCEGKDRCDFCDVEKLTSCEPFGRMRGEYAVTCGNVFKGAGVHGLVIWKQHFPHRLSALEVVDGFKVADQWFRCATSWDADRGKAAFPVLFWNMFRAAGASQIHPHMQVQLHTGPVGKGALLRTQSERYSKDGRDLCQDVVLAHRHLGLARDFAETVCWASLTPAVGGGEFCVLGSGDSALEDIAEVTALLIASFRRLKAEALSIFALPVPVAGQEAWLLRLSNRGPCVPGVVDTGSCELHGVCSVVTDPFALIRAVDDEIATSSA